MSGKVVGKTLCKILTAADAMPPHMVDLGVNGNLSRYGSGRLFLQLDGNRAGSPLSQRDYHVVTMWANSGSKAMPPGHTQMLSIATRKNSCRV